jgi:hypothetical protein
VFQNQDKMIYLETRSEQDLTRKEKYSKFKTRIHIKIHILVIIRGPNMRLSLKMT